MNAAHVTPPRGFDYYGHTGIPDPSSPRRFTLGILRQWFIREGSMAQPGEPVGIVEIHGQAYQVIICFPARIERLLVDEGSRVKGDDLILKWLALGNHLPRYRQPSFRLERCLSGSRVVPIRPALYL